LHSQFVVIFQTNHNFTNQEKENFIVENIQYSRNQKKYKNIMKGFGPMLCMVNGLGLTLHGSVRVKINIFI
jgi:hypothetical protein